MRVVHVAPTPFGAGGLLGGGERYPVELSRALARHVDCTLVTFGGQARVTREDDGLTIRVLRSLGRVGGHPAQPVAPHLALHLDADVVHTHHTRSAPSVLAAVAARGRRTAVVTTDHGLGTAGRWRALHPLFDGFLTVSAHSAAVLGAPAHKTSVIYGGADARRYAPDPSTTRSGVLFVGRITPHKGIDVLVRALPHGATLTIAGSGGHDPRPPARDYPTLLRKLASGRDVRFIDAPSDEEMRSLYRGAQVLVLPSVHTTCYGHTVAISELLGLTLLEAMASGTAVIASDVGGLREVVQHGETGFLVAPGDVEALRDRLAELLSQPALAERLGRAARARVLDVFTWDAVAQRCLRAYEDVLRARQASGPA